MTLVLKWRVVEITCMAGQQCLMGTDVSLTRLTADPSPAPRGEEQTCYRWLVCLWSSLLKTRFKLGSNLVEDMKAVVYRQTPGEEDKRSLKKPWSGVSCKKSWRRKREAQQCVLVFKKGIFLCLHCTRMLVFFDLCMNIWAETVCTTQHKRCSVKQQMTINLSTAQQRQQHKALTLPRRGKSAWNIF